MWVLLKTGNLVVNCHQKGFFCVGGGEEERKMKYVLVTGGVVSGLGKGVTASSIGLILKACGLRVTSIKIGLYLFLSGFIYC